MSTSPEDKIMEFIQRRAMEVVALPEDKREEHYNLVYKSCRSSALNLGQSPKEADQWADKTVEFTKALVSIIETSGGAGGGKA